MFFLLLLSTLVPTAVTSDGIDACIIVANEGACHCSSMSLKQRIVAVIADVGFTRDGQLFINAADVPAVAAAFSDLHG